LFVYVVHECLFGEFNHETIYASHEAAMIRVKEFTGEENPSKSENWRYSFRKTPQFREQEIETWTEVGEDSTGDSIEIIKYLVHE
jgi:hypothetical protein